MSDSLEGRVYEVTDEASLRAAITIAFDYRGDVTITLDDGEEVFGYVFNRDLERAAPFLDYLPPSEQAAPVRLDATRIRRVALTGRDTADGRSWEAWLERHRERS